jgi:hypothetical protein
MTVKTRHSTWEHNPLFDHENINEQENKSMHTGKDLSSSISSLISFFPNNNNPQH